MNTKLARALFFCSLMLCHASLMWSAGRPIFESVKSLREFLKKETAGTSASRVVVVLEMIDTDSSRAIGLACLHINPNEDFGSLARISVNKAFRKHGFGNILLFYAMKIILDGCGLSKMQWTAVAFDDVPLSVLVKFYTNGTKGAADKRYVFGDDGDNEATTVEFIVRRESFLAQFKDELDASGFLFQEPTKIAVSGGNYRLRVSYCYKEQMDGNLNATYRCDFRSHQKQIVLKGDEGDDLEKMCSEARAAF